MIAINQASLWTRGRTLRGTITCMCALAMLASGCMANTRELGESRADLDFEVEEHDPGSADIDEVRPPREEPRTDLGFELEFEERDPRESEFDEVRVPRTDYIYFDGECRDRSFFADMVSPEAIEFVVTGARCDLSRTPVDSPPIDPGVVIVESFDTFATHAFVLSSRYYADASPRPSDYDYRGNYAVVGGFAQRVFTDDGGNVRTTTELRGTIRRRLSTSTGTRLVNDYGVLNWQECMYTPSPSGTRYECYDSSTGETTLFVASAAGDVDPDGCEWLGNLARNNALFGCATGFLLTGTAGAILATLAGGAIGTSVGPVGTGVGVGAGAALGSAFLAASVATSVVACPGMSENIGMLVEAACDWVTTQPDLDAPCHLSSDAERGSAEYGGRLGECDLEAVAPLTRSQDGSGLAGDGLDTSDSCVGAGGTWSSEQTTTVCTGSPPSDVPQLGGTGQLGLTED